MWWMLTAEQFDTTEARRIGIVRAVVPDDTHVRRAIEIAQVIARQAPLGVRATLHNARLAQRDSVAAAEAEPRADRAETVRNRGCRNRSASVPHLHPSTLRRTLRTPMRTINTERTRRNRAGRQPLAADHSGAGATNSPMPPVTIGGFTSRSTRTVGCPVSAPRRRNTSVAMSMTNHHGASRARTSKHMRFSGRPVSGRVRRLLCRVRS